VTVSEDIERIIEQERRLVFPGFDEHTAFAIGSAIRERALKEGLGLVADVRLWDRPLFYVAMPGTTADNPQWVRRKANTVQRLQKSTYRVVLEKSWEGDVFPPGRGLDPMEFVLAGGGFPIRVQGVGVIGAVTVSGLPQRDDHAVVVRAICEQLGLDAAALALPPG
jgi:uncharacterized protein (UPF0303 family)